MCHPKAVLTSANRRNICIANGSYFIQTISRQTQGNYRYEQDQTDAKSELNRNLKPKLKPYSPDLG